MKIWIGLVMNNKRMIFIYQYTDSYRLLLLYCSSFSIIFLMYFLCTAKNCYKIKSLLFVCVCVWLLLNKERNIIVIRYFLGQFLEWKAHDNWTICRMYLQCAISESIQIVVIRAAWLWHSLLEKKRRFTELAKLLIKLTELTEY